MITFTVKRTVKYEIFTNHSECGHTQWLDQKEIVENMGNFKSLESTWVAIKSDEYWPNQIKHTETDMPGSKELTQHEPN